MNIASSIAVGVYTLRLHGMITSGQITISQSYVEFTLKVVADCSKATIGTSNLNEITVT